MRKLSDIVPALFAAALAAVWLCACSSGNAPRPDRSEYTYTLSQKKLLDIIEEQDRFFERIRGKSRMSHSDALSLKSKIDSLWAEYLAEFPDDVDALVLNGKFLRATGDDELSYKQFSRADALSPNLPVVKQQLANYEAEHGLAKHAYDNMRAAVSLAPENSVYRLQLAQLILVFREELIAGHGFSQDALDAELAQSYARAAELEPENGEIRKKYALSFYDLGRADWNEALRQWNIVLEKFSPLNIDKQTALANKARVLVELGRDADAREILEKVDAPALQADKRKLLEIMDAAKNGAEQTKTKSEYQWTFFQK